MVGIGYVLVTYAEASHWADSSVTAVVSLFELFVSLGEGHQTSPTVRMSQTL